MFAALREAAGQGEDSAPPGPLPALLDELRVRHGERFAAVLAGCSVLIDGTAVGRDAQVEVADGAELALLPPVSGGATGTVTVARALGSSTRADIYAHLREAGDERTVRDIASRFELHPNVARTHLELLADAGLVRVGRRKHPGGGRPAKVYLALGEQRPADEGGRRAEPQADPTLLVRLLAALLEAPGVDASGRPVVASARRTTLTGRAYEAAVAEGRRLVSGERRKAALAEAAQTALAALRPCAPQVRAVGTGEDWIDVTGLRDVVGPLVGIRPDLADAFERGLWSGALAAAGSPVTLLDAGVLPGGGRVWRARAIAARARVHADPCARVDTRGLPRDEAVVAAVRAAQAVSRGDVLEVLTEGAGSPAAFARWADRSGHQLLAVERAADGAAIRLLVRKG
jgi:predicted ArsR family transcriptional regulator/TusA-related sulfurtransferase/molybdopterin converting factor small subunit